jgi:hypothetical protein
MSASDSKSFPVRSDDDRRYLASLMGRVPEGWVVQIKPPPRTLGQNAAFHATLSEIAATGFAIDGRPLKLPELKVAFVSGWSIEMGYGSDIIRGFQDEPVQLVRSTTTFGTSEMASLIDYTTAECGKRGIPLRERLL